MTRATILLIGCAMSSAVGSAPSVVSINLCTDQLVLNVASPEQILSLSWLAADADESMMAAEAAAFPLNYGSAEEVIRFAPDVVVAGRYSSPYTKALVSRLGMEVVEIEPARSLADIERNLLRVGRAIGRDSAAAAVVRQMHDRAAAASTSSAAHISAIVLRPGGYTIETESLAHELLEMAGLRDVAVDAGLDSWGSLSVETLLRLKPEVLVISDYKLGSASLANAWLMHPAISELSATRASIPLSPTWWSCGTPQSLASVELIVSAIDHLQ